MAVFRSRCAGSTWVVNAKEIGDLDRDGAALGEIADPPSTRLRSGLSSRRCTNRRNRPTHRNRRRHNSEYRRSRRCKCRRSRLSLRNRRLRSSECIHSRRCTNRHSRPSHRNRRRHNSEYRRSRRCKYRRSRLSLRNRRLRSLGYSSRSCRFRHTRRSCRTRSPRNLACKTSPGHRHHPRTGRRRLHHRRPVPFCRPGQRPGPAPSYRLGQRRSQAPFRCPGQRRCQGTSRPCRRRRSPEHSPSRRREERRPTRGRSHQDACTPFRTRLLCHTPSSYSRWHTGPGTTFPPQEPLRRLPVRKSHALGLLFWDNPPAGGPCRIDEAAQDASGEFRKARRDHVAYCIPRNLAGLRTKIFLILVRATATAAVVSHVVPPAAFHGCS